MEHSVKLTFYGGVNKVGGNQVLLEDFGYNVKIFIDFGINQAEYQECRKTYNDPNSLDQLTFFHVIPRAEDLPIRNFYSKYYLLDHKKEKFNQKVRECEGKFDPPSDLDAILISHPHRDHYAGLSFVNRNIPIYTGVVTKRIIRAHSNCSPTRFSNFLYGLNWKKFRTGNTITIKGMEIYPVHVDHSIPAAYGFVICSSAGIIVYSGDFRMHGPMSFMTIDLIKKVKETCKIKERAVALICEGTNIHKGAIESEKAVKRQLNLLFKTNPYDYLIVQYERVDWDRFRTYVDIANKYNWKYVITEKDAYFYHRLNNKAIYDSMKDPDILNNENILVLTQPSSRFSWQKDIRKAFREHGIEDRFMKLNELKSINDKFLLYITSIKEFDTIQSYIPYHRNGAFISSSIDPYAEEYRDHTKRISNILEGVGIPTYKIHASAHAKPHDLMKFVKEINPENLLPIHTERASFFKKLFKNFEMKVILPVRYVPIEMHP